jgi:hypothetical protein
MHIRVAVAEHPAGPFKDSGHRLTSSDFAIDPHIFQDDDGRRWMFYATDFLSHSHIGTGTVRDLMLDTFSLAGRPAVVSRARFNWQVFDAQREEKGGVRWHTVGGTLVFSNTKGNYYQMFSGGNWKNTSYGVGLCTHRRYKCHRRMGSTLRWTSRFTDIALFTRRGWTGAQLGDSRPGQYPTLLCVPSVELTLRKSAPWPSIGWSSSVQTSP